MARTATLETIQERTVLKLSNKPVVDRKKENGYVRPTTSIFPYLPDALVPYAELMRIDRPAGYYAFFWHYGIGLAFAACVVSPTIPPTTLLILTAYLAAWVLILRGAVCTWNDNLDQDFDRQVERCKNRAIARGAVSTLQGHIFTFAQTALCAYMLRPFSPAVWIYAAVMGAILTIYPLGKRVTDFPQVILGSGFAIPVFMCVAMFGDDLLTREGTIDGQDVANLKTGAVCLYLAGWLWTIVFDTIYAHQDIKDDKKAGVKGLAVRLGDNTKLGCGIMGACQVGLLVATGYLCNLSTSYFVVACGGTAAALVAMLALVDLETPSSCAWWFGPGSRLVGASVILGLLSHYFTDVTGIQI